MFPSRGGVAAGRGGFFGPMNSGIIPYRSYLKTKARILRRNMTLAEVLLWNRLKRRQVLGYDLDR